MKTRTEREIATLDRPTEPVAAWCLYLLLCLLRLKSFFSRQLLLKLDIYEASRDRGHLLPPPAAPATRQRLVVCSRLMTMSELRVIIDFSFAWCASAVFLLSAFSVVLFQTRRIYGEWGDIFSFICLLKHSRLLEASRNE